MAVASKVNRIDMYTQAAHTMGIDTTQQPMRTSCLMDGVVWDGTAPDAYVNQFDIRS